jgi:hypothetical protein
MNQINKFIILCLFIISPISLILTNKSQSSDEKTTLTISEEQIEKGTFEMPYTLAACMIINGIATTSIEWMFESSKPYIGITLEIQYCESSCGAKMLLSDGSKYKDSGVYNVSQEGIYQFLFWNKDSDKERTNITYYMVFDPGIHTPSISGYNIPIIGLITLCIVILLVWKSKKGKQSFQFI